MGNLAGKCGWVSTAVVAMGNEGQRHDARRPRRAAHHELERRAERSLRRRDIAHGDRPVGRGAEAAAGDAADDAARGIGDLRALARRRAAFGLDADALPRRAVLELALDHRRAGKAAFGAAALLDRPGKIGLDDAGGLVDVVAMEAEPGL